jgi:hypothetical protein
VVGAAVDDGGTQSGGLGYVDEVRVPGAAGGLAEGYGFDATGRHAASLLSAARKAGEGEQR